ncbi:MULTISPECIES: hypothetical protein [unclassified Rhizobium]|nr:MULTISPECIES: hypothetical protein [unclassified Rhizobium]MBB3543716.1 hypothetical protein [Rhizobium sp. BK399]MCS3741956.1 hypothetical protein [Rhizobium sp. BK661]MCS4095352.1 hypothetical protein [Rhizobium sp. BK176]
MVVFDDRRVAPRFRFAGAAADLAAQAATILAFGFLFAATLGVF